MFNTYISNSTFKGLAGVGHTQVPVLRKGETGVALTLNFEIANHRVNEFTRMQSLSGLKTTLPPAVFGQTVQTATISSAEVDDLAFMYALTYFDRVVYSVPSNPVTKQVFLKLTDLQKRFFELDATNLMPVYPEGPSGEIAGRDGILHFDKPALDSFRKGCGIEFDQLLNRDGPEWQIGNGAYGVHFAPNAVSKSGFLFRLHDKLPIVSKVPDPEDFLRWKADRRPERQALASAINEFIGCIDEANAEDLERKLLSIERQCYDLVRISREKFPGVVLRPVKFHFNWERAKSGREYGGYAGGLGGLYCGDTEVGAAVGAALGHLAGFEIQGGPTHRSSLIKASPFASIVELQYKK